MLDADRDSMDARPARRSSSSGCTTSSSTRSCCSWTSSTCCRRTRCGPRTARRKSTVPRRPSRHGWRAHRGRPGRDRPRRRRVRVRQRVAAPPRVPRAVRARGPAGHVRRVARVHRRRRLPPRPSSGCPTAGRPCRRSSWDAPLYWERDEDGWQVFTLAGMQPDRPERAGLPRQLLRGRRLRALAGARLPTEAEWEAAAATASRPRSCARRTGRFGDVWEWTASAYLPYPASGPAAGAVGEYNGKFMVNQHVLRGGCGATPAGHVARDVPQLLPAGRPLGVQRRPTRARRLATSVSGPRGIP